MIITLKSQPTDGISCDACARQPTVISFTPTGDPAPGLAVDRAVYRGQADGIYVICEIHRGRQLQEAHVVVVGQRVVRRVTRCLDNTSGHFVGVGSCLVDATQKNRDGAGVTFFLTQNRD